MSSLRGRARWAGVLVSAVVALIPGAARAEPPPDRPATPAEDHAGSTRGPEPPAEYETVVRARAVRREASRQTLRREEVTRLPGTMGDPFRIVETLPGVVPLLTGVPYYYVRGAPPADTGTFLDGFRIPALFHLALGPSVVHPTLVDRVDFFTGGAPVRYPGFVGGVISARSAEIPRDRVHLDADVRLVDSGAMLTVPLEGGRTRVAASGRYSYTAALLTALQEDAFVDYWDYQLRFERDLSPRHTIGVMALGAFDEAGAIEHLDRGGDRPSTEFAQVFHHLDVRSRHRLAGRRSLEVAAGIGLEQTLLGEDGIRAQDVTFGPRATLTQPLGPDVELRIGADQTTTLSSFVASDFEDAPTPTRHLVAGGLYTEAAIRLAPDTTVLPGVRLGLYEAGGEAAAALDPRLGVRHELAPGVTLKGSVGLYHQPPAFVLPLPGFGALDWNRGLQRSVQLSQGVEWKLPWDLLADVQLFYHRYENLSDATVEDVDDEPPFDPDHPDEGVDFERAFPRLRGNAYGLEAIVRRRLTARLFGWVAYTFSRSERLFGGAPRSDDCDAATVVVPPPSLVPSDADRTHVLNLIASYELPGGFRVGSRVHLRTGRPFTRHRCWTLSDGSYRATYGPRAGERMPTFFRVDLRVDKRWRYRGWDLELYFEIQNVTFARDVAAMDQPEEQDGRVGEPEADSGAIPLVIPTLGLRGVF